MSTQTTTNAIETKLREASASEAEHNWELNWKGTTNSFMEMLSESCSVTTYYTGDKTAPFLTLPRRSTHYFYEVYIRDGTGRSDSITDEVLIEIKYLETQIHDKWIAHETERIFQLKLQHLLSVAGVA